MDKLRKALSGDDNESERGIMDEINEVSTWSWETRIKGFIGCFIVGALLSLLGVLSIFTFHYVMFALLCTLGSLTAIMSTFFLVGPFKQLQKMFAPTRLIATVVTLLMIVLTLMAGLLWKKGGLCIIFMFLQYAAMIWYALSYIPYARDAVTKCCNSFIA